MNYYKIKDYVTLEFQSLLHVTSKLKIIFNQSLRNYEQRLLLTMKKQRLRN